MTGTQKRGCSPTPAPCPPSRPTHNVLKKHGGVTSATAALQLRLTSYGAVSIAVFASLLASSVITAGSSAAGGAGRHACSRPRHDTVVQNDEAVLVLRGHELRGCVLATGEHRGLADGVNELAFPPPALRLARTIAAWAVDIYSPENGGLGTGLYVGDLRDPSVRVFPTYAFNANGNRIGSLQVKVSTAVAWIQCKSTGKDQFGSPRPDCVRPGGVVKSVYKHDATTQGDPQGAHLLDSGRSIDPRSLRLHGSTLTWKHKGRRRHATLM